MYKTKVQNTPGFAKKKGNRSTNVFLSFLEYESNKCIYPIIYLEYLLPDEANHVWSFSTEINL